MGRLAAITVLQADLAAGRPAARLIPPALELSRSLASDGLRQPARAAALLAVEAAVAAGAQDEAARILAAAPRGERSDPIGLRLQARYVTAAAARGAGDFGRALRAVRAGLGEVAAHQAKLGSLDLRTASAVHGRRLAALHIQLALRDGRPATVFAAAERARAISTRIPPVRPPADPRTAELFGQLRRAVEQASDVDVAAEVRADGLGSAACSNAGSPSAPGPSPVAARYVPWRRSPACERPSMRPGRRWWSTSRLTVTCPRSCSAPAGPVSTGSARRPRSSNGSGGPEPISTRLPLPGSRTLCEPLCGPRCAGRASGWTPRCWPRSGSQVHW